MTDILCIKFKIVFLYVGFMKLTYIYKEYKYYNVYYYYYWINKEDCLLKRCLIHWKCTGRATAGSAGAMLLPTWCNLYYTFTKSL